jgi:small subunit ribosomal protein S3
VIGIKVWVFKGEVLGRGEQPVAAPAPEPERNARRGAKNAATS